jgi:hypothetical protein
MEKIYRKDEKGRYYSVGYNDVVDLADGVWLVQSKPSSKSITSMVWKVGDIKRPVDVVTHASIQAMERDLVKYIQKLSDINSQEYKDAEKICGGYLRGAVNFTNISSTDLVSLLLRQIAFKIESEQNEKLK